MKKKKWISVLLVGILISAAAILGACGTEDSANNSNNNNENTENKENGEHVTIDLYFMEVTETAFELGLETREFTDPDPEALVEALIEGPQDTDLTRVIPENTELLNAYIEDNVAYVDFSQEITEAQYGAEGEHVLVTSIVQTLIQLDEVEAVQILVEGEIIESIGGHVVIDEPL